MLCKLDNICFLRIDPPLSQSGGLLAEGIHKVSQNSLNILHGTDIGCQPLSLTTSEDPGYETVRLGPVPTSPESDPNYEAVLPNAAPVQKSARNMAEYDDGYSKIGSKVMLVVGTTASSSATAMNSGTNSDGYSSIKDIPSGERRKGGSSSGEAVGMDGDRDDDDDEEEVEPGYSKIKETKTCLVHGYASIEETKKGPVMTATKDDEGTGDDPAAGRRSSHNYSTINEMMTTSATTIGTTTSGSSISPISVNYFPVINVETSSPGAYSSATPPSSDYSLTDVGRGGGSSGAALADRNYESLTDDPNYESVTYLTAKENPYELLEESEKNTPEVNEVHLVAVVGDDKDDGRGSDKKPDSDCRSSPCQVVDDYFQV